MKTKLFFIGIIAAVVLVIGSCTKAGTGGNATVICKVFNSDNNGAAVNGATVYVKYGQSTPPGAGNTGYDDHKTADANNNSVTFTGLKQGTYYFYAEASIPTSATPATVSGGGPFSLTRANRNGTSNATVSVAY